MFLYRHKDGRVGTGPGAWFAVKDALGAEANGLVDGSEESHWDYKVVQINEMGMETMTSVRQMPLIVNGEEMGMFHEVTGGAKASSNPNVKIAVNHVVNDKGETVIAVGAPGSVARAKVQWPALIENLNRLYASAYESHGRAVDEAVEMIRAAGVKGRMETDSILMASDYSNESQGSVTSLVRSIDGTPPAYKGTWARRTQMTKKQAAKNDEVADGRLDKDRKDKGQEPLNNTLEGGVDSDRKDNVDQAHQLIEKNLRDKKGPSGPNSEATGLVERRLNEAKTTLYPHRNEEAWARTGEKRPVNALPEELGKASEDKKRERWSAANKAGGKRLLDKDVGKQLDLPKTKIEQKTAFNLRSKRMAGLKPYEEYLAYKESKPGGWGDKFSKVREIDAKMSEIMKSASLSKEQKAELNALKESKSRILVSDLVGLGE